MAIGGKPLSASLATIEFFLAGSGTRLTYTEQGTYFDDPNAAKSGEERSRELLEKPAAELQSSN